MPCPKALAEPAPEVGIEVVEVSTSRDGLRALHDQIVARLDPSAR